MCHSHHLFVVVVVVVVVVVGVGVCVSGKVGRELWTQMRSSIPLRVSDASMLSMRHVVSSPHPYPFVELVSMIS
jgi:uncharacterized protein (DUF983 family)